MSKQQMLCNEVVPVVGKRGPITMDDLVEVLSNLHGVHKEVARSGVIDTLQFGYIHELSDGNIVRMTTVSDVVRYSDE